MKYALVIVEDKSSVSKGTQALRNLADKIETWSKTTGANLEILNVGAYLVPLNRGLLALSHLVLEAEADKLSVRTLFFEEEPSWH